MIMNKRRIIMGIGFIIAAATCIYSSHVLYADPITPEQRTCERDEDCQWIRTSCSSCCPDLNDSAAVNVKFAKDYENLGRCTDAHVKACGVPECGLESPAPVAVCQAGLCSVVMRFSGQK
jgi:hypothetical protein